MRLLRFSLETPVGRTVRSGLLTADGGGVIDLRATLAADLVAGGADADAADRYVAAACPGDMTTLIGLGEHGLELARRAAGSPHAVVLPLTAVTLEAPLRPGMLRDCIAFEEHIRHTRGMRGAEIPEEWYRIPVYTKLNPSTVIGSGAEVVWPSYSETIDYELELAVVIGKGGRDIEPANAHSHILGVTVLNDLSARDMQMRESSVGAGPAKGKDFATALGPWIVTLDEIPDLYALEMTARVNGEEWSRGTTADMYHRWDAILAHASQDEELRPGDVFGSGTCGNGCGLELGRYLADGDVVELEIERIGVLRNLIRTARDG